MRAFLEAQIHRNSIVVSLFQKHGDRTVVVDEVNVETKTYGPHENIPRAERPAIEVEPQVLIEFHDSLTKELRRLGFIRPEPSIELLQEKDAQIKNLREQVATLQETLAGVTKHAVASMTGTGGR